MSFPHRFNLEIPFFDEPDQLVGLVLVVVKHSIALVLREVGSVSFCARIRKLEVSFRRAFIPRRSCY